MSLKRIVLVLACAFVATAVSAQGAADSLRSAAVDSTLLGKNILTVIGSGVKVNQSQAVRSAFDQYVERNGARPLTGYRIRVFYDNGQSARTRSEAIARSVAATYPDLGVYHTFESPNFKVSVGDFRTKDEALKVYNELKALYPTAFILKETINYPR